MKSYTTLRNLYGSLTNNTETVNLTLGDELINDRYRAICSSKDWPFLHQLKTTTTIASTTFIPIPNPINQIESVYVTVGSTRYNPTQAPSRKFWDQLHYSSYTSDFPEWWYVYDGQLGLWPTPTTTGNIVSINGRIKIQDLSIADYTTGTIASITNGTNTIIGTSTTWTDQMAGRWIKITYSDTTNTGDGNWYKIESVTNSTTLVLLKPYTGSTIVGGTASYTIGQMPELPEAFHMTPVRGAVADYWLQQEDITRAARYEQQYNNDLRSLSTIWSSSTTDMVIDTGEEDVVVNPNLIISL